MAATSATGQAAAALSTNTAEATLATSSPLTALPGELKYVQYEHPLESVYLPAIRALISKDLSEPYSIYVYRYFLYQWGHLCYMVRLAPPLSPPTKTKTPKPLLEIFVTSHIYA